MIVVTRFGVSNYKIIIKTYELRDRLVQNRIAVVTKLPAYDKFCAELFNHTNSLIKII